MQENNPYRAPHEEPVYFTDDVTSLRVRYLWKVAYRIGMVGVLVAFPILLFRKLIRIPFAATHATRRMTDLSSIRFAEVPVEFREPFAPLEAVCRAAGMEPAIHVRPPWIGGKWGFYSLWLDPSGKVYATITTIHLRMGEMLRTKTTLSCHSRLKAGGQLHTGGVDPADWIPEMVPPGHQMLVLDPATPPEEVIARHRSRLQGAGEVISFTKESLEGEFLRNNDELFDYLIAKRIYIPVSNADVDRLRR